jgi:hypothetical protein
MCHVSAEPRLDTPAARLLVSGTGYERPPHLLSPVPAIDRVSMRLYAAGDEPVRGLPAHM